MDKDEKFQRGIAHFNAQEFFEAHEVWEEIWLVEAEPEKTFLQGIIQIAAAFHHYCRANTDGTESLLAAGIVKLSRFPRNHRGLNIEELRSSAKHWARSVGKGEKWTGRRFRSYAGATRISGRSVPGLRIDNKLAFHGFVLFATALTARIRIGARGITHHVDRKSFTLSKFPAVFAKDKIQTGRRFGLGAIWKRIDSDTQRGVNRGCEEANFLSNLDVNYGRVELEILYGQSNALCRRTSVVVRDMLCLQGSCERKQQEYCGHQGDKEFGSHSFCSSVHVAQGIHSSAMNLAPQSAKNS